jgi:NAD(P)-dependent dehydrogenase (short-subunit alcohol dehydrogenase family)
MQEGWVILVTGASRGIGAALVENFARSGHRVILNYAHAKEEAERLFAALIQDVGDRVMLCRADVGNRSEVRAMFDAALERFGRVDVLINNAGVNMDGPFLKMTDAQWDRVIATNLTGTFICAQEFVLRFRGEVGHIITLGASTAIRGRLNGANYCSAKAGVMALTKCLALELAPRVRVNCVIPGRTATDEVMTRFDLHDPARYAEAVGAIPMQRLGRPEDVYRVVRFLIEEAEYITGQNFFVNGGNYMG